LNLKFLNELAASNDRYFKFTALEASAAGHRTDFERERACRPAHDAGYPASQRADKWCLAPSR
jgi:hypothetical protein